MWRPTFSIGPIHWPLELDHCVTDFYATANFAIGPIDWHLEFPAPPAGAQNSTSPATPCPSSGWLPVTFVWQGRESPHLQPLGGWGHEPPLLQPLGGRGHEPSPPAALRWAGACAAPPAALSWAEE